MKIISPLVLCTVVYNIIQLKSYSSIQMCTNVVQIDTMLWCGVCVQLEYDPMHLFDHGLTIHVLKYGIKQLLRLEEKLGLPKYTLVKKLIQRLRLQKGNVRGRDGQTLSRHHQTLLGLPNTVVKLLNGLAGKSSESKRSSPMVECNEMQRLAVCLACMDRI